MAKYMILFSLTGETVKRFLAKPSDRAAVVRQLAEAAGGSLESYYWMFGQYDGAAVIELPDSRTAAALSLAVTSSGAFSRYETHELIEAVDLSAIAERAKAISYQPPGALPARRLSQSRRPSPRPAGNKLVPVMHLHDRYHQPDRLGVEPSRLQMTEAYACPPSRPP